MDEGSHFTRIAAEAEARFRNELLVILRRCAKLAKHRTIPVRCKDNVIEVHDGSTSDEIVKFVERATPAYIHVANLGRPSEGDRIRWADLRFGVFRRTVRTLAGLFCTALPASEMKNRVYRLMGMSIAVDVEIFQGAFLDPFAPRMITLGAGTVVGAFARIFTHAYRGQGRLMFGPVTIGRDVVISGMATVGPCLIEDDVTILPGAITVGYLHLRAGSTFGGKLRDGETARGD